MLRPIILAFLLLTIFYLPRGLSLTQSLIECVFQRLR